MERLVEVSEQEVRMDFMLNSKRRANVHLRSLCHTAPIAFKVQTSSPHKFLVNPPSGLVPPSSSTTIQIILKPQNQLPPTFPRSPSDRFLIRTALLAIDSADSTHPDLFNLWNSTSSTQDVKLKVVFVGPFLLHHAVSRGDIVSVRSIIRKQKSVLAELSPGEAESLLRVATELVNSEDMVNLLLEAGLRIETSTAGFYHVDSRWVLKGWSELHVAVAFDRTEEVVRLVNVMGCEPLDWRGRTPLHLAASKGFIRCAKVLVESGADKDAKSTDGRTALHRAAANGDRSMVEMLLGMGADPTILDHRGRSALDLARYKVHEEVVEILEQGDGVLMAARCGHLQHLDLLLQKGASLNYCDQYGLTALHAASIKCKKDVVSMLIEFGVDLECQDNEGHTPLHMAVEGCSIETVEVLVNNGANVNAKSKGGVTPLFMAKAMGYNDISQFLINRGASSSPTSSSSISSM